MQVQVQGEWELVVRVEGTPAGQGRLSHKGRGRLVHSNAERLLPWRERIVWAARQAARGRANPARPLWVGVPVQTDMTVTVAKPKSAPKRRRSWPITRFSSDGDHHARAIHDALAQAGVIKDDAQVVEHTLRKVYPGEHPLALGVPGAVIRVRRLPESVCAGE